MKTSAQLRQAFLDYFAQAGHELVPGSSLIPQDDPTLLFTNAGMVQFKNVFLGQERRAIARAASSQPCVRAGGKHNDLENVGYTARHHTFFEMLGNFSFGDYFKREAIHYAWNFLTQTLALPPEKLWVTVYEDDDEAADLWIKDIGVDPARFSRCGAKDNFWSMGDTGPCGPCSEIFYDHGPDIPGGPPGSPDADGDRYIEIWNLVFMQFNRAADGTLTPLPKPSVDTGMGLERLAAVMQGVHSNYEIDVFQHLIVAAAQVTGHERLEEQSLRVIADHIRSCSFLITDGVSPSNEGRGYVLRRIIRRAIRHGYQLGVREPFFHRLVAPLAEWMGDAYPQLRGQQAGIEHVLLLEEQRFAETLELGMRHLETAMAQAQDGRIAGTAIFKLYDTYGFPVDLTADIARERQLQLDMEGFEREMASQRERARAASHFTLDSSTVIPLEGVTEFTGYRCTEDQGIVAGLFSAGAACAHVEPGVQAIVVLDRTPFYAESGGQLGDTGEICLGEALFSVQDTRKQAGLILHLGVLRQGRLRLGDLVEARVDARRRWATALNHSATHLLHAALRQVLGSHVSQKGSQVGPQRLRFDFAHFEPVTAEQLQSIERLVNAQIRANYPVETRLMALDDAKKTGALALFGEKYGDQVRVLRMGEFSTELCGGTHIKAVGDIGLFKLVMESGVAAGIRRIEAVTGELALAWVEAAETRLRNLSRMVKSTPDELEQRIEQLLDKQRKLEKDLTQLHAKLVSSSGADLAARARTIGSAQVLAERLDGADLKTLRTTLDRLRDQLGSAVILLAAVNGDKVDLVCGVSADLTNRIKAGDLIKAAAEPVGGRGGGRADMAQAGGNQPGGLSQALALVPDWVRARLDT